MRKTLDDADISASKALPALIVITGALALLLTQGIPDSENEPVEVSIDSERYPFRIGKIQGSKTVIDSNTLSVGEGVRELDFWESPTFQLVSVDRLTVSADLEGNNSGTVKLMSSTNPEFERKGVYYAPASISFRLEDGKNTFEITSESNSKLRKYVRVYFSLRNGDGEGKPVIESYSLTGRRNPSELLMAYSY